MRQFLVKIVKRPCTYSKIVTLRFRFRSGGGLKEKFDDIAPNINFLRGFVLSNLNKMINIGYNSVRIHTLKLSAEQGSGGRNILMHISVAGKVSEEIF